MCLAELNSKHILIKTKTWKTLHFTSIYLYTRARVRRSSFAKSAFAKSSRKKTLDACMHASSSSSSIRGLTGAYKQSDKSKFHLWDICIGGGKQMVCAHHNFRSFWDTYYYIPVTICDNCVIFEAFFGFRAHKWLLFQAKSCKKHANLWKFTESR